MRYLVPASLRLLFFQTASLAQKSLRLGAFDSWKNISSPILSNDGICWRIGVSTMFQYEQEKSMLAGTIWGKTLLNIENSPIFNLPKLNTPFLILYNAWRRLDKSAWMLTYNDKDHNLTKRPNKKDLSIRMIQFFDYYLKEKAQPVLMAEGVPAMSKSKIYGYKLEK